MEEIKFDFESLPTPAWILDCASGFFLAFNHEAKILYGIPDDVIHNLRSSDLVIESSKNFAGKFTENSATSSWSEYQLHRKLDGSTIGVIVRCTTRPSSSSQILSCIIISIENQSDLEENGISKDITITTSDPTIFFNNHTLKSLVSLLETTSFAIAICNFENGKWIYCNDALRNILGIELFEWKEKTSIDMELWIDPLERSKLISLLVHHDKFEALPVKMRHRMGFTLDVQVSACTFISEGAKYTIASYNDRTEIMTRLRAVEANEALLSRALRGASSAVWEWDLRTDTYHNVERWENLLGYDPGELPHNSSTLSLLLHPDDAAIINSKLEAHFTDFKPFTAEARLKTKTGNYRWFFVRGQAEKDSDGRATRMSGTIDDVTEKKLLDLERLRINERLALAIGAVALGTWEVFPDNSAIWDAQTYRIYGRDPATSLLPEVIFRESLTPLQMERTTQWMTETIKHKVFSTIEFPIIWPNGEERWIAAKGKPIRNTQGRFVCILGVNWDITEQKRSILALEKYQFELSCLNNRLIEQEKRISKDIAYSLHDQLGQTLTALRLGIETLQMKSLLGAEFERQCSALQNLSAKAIQEVRDALTRLRPPMLDELGLGRAIESEILMTPISTDSPTIHLNADQSALDSRWPSNVEYAFFMVGREAITNALKHSKCQNIDVLLDVKNGSLYLQIRDNGKGFTQSAPKPGIQNLGLVSMRERAQAVQAQLVIETSLHSGTSINLRWPAQNHEHNLPN